MLWPGCFRWNSRDDAGDDVFCEGGIGVEVFDDDCDIDRGFVGFPAIIVRDHAERCEGDFRFAAESGFRSVGHSDEIEAVAAIHVRFGAGRESRAVHGGIGSAVVESCGVMRGGFEEESAHGIAVGIAEGNVGGDTVSEKGKFMRAPGAIDELVRDDDVPGFNIFPERTDRVHGNDPAHVQRTQCPDVGAVVDFMGEQAVAAAMAGKKEYAAAGEFAFDDFIRGRAERSFDRVGADDFQGIDFIKAGAADDG